MFGECKCKNLRGWQPKRGHHKPPRQNIQTFILEKLFQSDADHENVCVKEEQNIKTPK